ncbi:uncharacterized protein B0I36DRAFT_251351 [Microdochium trichocladiopsis]|uniref:Short chain dehydrogenase n=1 Tax=Microdochium trichocladiopsis TaxID=1682393 RepID=A0A9P9BLG3_9PEZI|nr:uncharacterized protein B0I36DRAFT_251351 [Microdochium trichocladiopsis]KAH7024864.1 hypothetical protein B0I36DRAFT_251351 [Microdochium trichocladiopsis]
MPSYLITGASGSLGFEMVRQASAEPENIVIGLVRNKTKMAGRIAKELSDRTNVHVVECELADYESLAASVEPVSQILNGGPLDYLMANAGMGSKWFTFKPFELQAKEPARVTEDFNSQMAVNVIANIHLFNLYLPFLRKSEIKKVITISSAHADVMLAQKYDVSEAMAYSASKAALNMVVAKYHASYGKSEGVLFMAMCPGVLLNDAVLEEPDEDAKKYGPAMFAKFATYAPHFTGPAPPAGPASDIFRIAAAASVEDGWGGTFTSHNGGTQWI